MVFFQKDQLKAIFDATRHIYSGIYNRKLTGLLFLDVAKAFNCISHKRLYKKLELIGFSMRCINWFSSYLSRSQHVLIKNTISCDINVDAGITQGMVLGPLIFIFYINDSVSCIKSSKIALFADDSVLYQTGNNWKDIHDLLQPDLDNISSWFNLNGLRLNATKTKALIVGSRNKINNMEISEKLPTKVHDIL